MCSTLSLYISLPLFWTTTTWNFQKLPGYTFYGGNVIRVLVHFPLLFIFTQVAASISHPLTAATEFHVVPPTKNVSFVFSLSSTQAAKPRAAINEGLSPRRRNKSRLSSLLWSQFLIVTKHRGLQSLWLVRPRRILREKADFKKSIYCLPSLQENNNAIDIHLGNHGQIGL